MDIIGYIRKVTGEPSDQDINMYRIMAIIGTVTFPIFAVLYDRIYSGEGYGNALTYILPVIFLLFTLLTFFKGQRPYIYPGVIAILYITTFYFINNLYQHSYPINMALTTTIAIAAFVNIFRTKLELKVYFIAVGLLVILTFVTSTSRTSESMVSFLVLIVWAGVLYYIIWRRFNTNDEIQIQKKFLEMVFNSISDPSFIIEHSNQRVVDCSQSGLHLLGLENKKRVIGHSFDGLQKKHLDNSIPGNFLSGKDFTSTRTLDIKTGIDCDTKYYQVTCVPFQSTEGRFALLSFSDMTNAIQETNVIFEMAYMDDLTKVGNRRKAMEDLDTIIGIEKGCQFGLFFIDVDKFKEVNDTYGHNYGDTLLKMISKRIRSSLDRRDSLYRIGGDEFMVILRDLNDTDKMKTVAKRLITAVNLPFCVDSQIIESSVSVGIASYPDDGNDKTSLLKSADIALYKSKEAGRNCYRSYNDR